MADPYYANVSLLLPMNGADNGTVFTDYSPTPKTITRYNAVTSTAQSQYYGSSGYFDGGDYLQIPSSTEFDFGTGDFTIEAWVRPTAFSADKVIVSRYTTWASAVAYYLGVRAGSPNILIFRAGNSVPITINGNTALATNAWVHVAAVRAGGVTSMYVGGVGQSATHTGSVSLSGTAPVRVGASNEATPSEYVTGYLQDVRITKGIARYTADFTPPPRLLPSISGTVLDTTGTPCASQVYVYNQASGALLASTTSDASTGHYEAFVHPATEEVFRVVVANEPTLYNNLIDRVIPA